MSCVSVQWIQRLDWNRLIFWPDSCWRWFREPGAPLCWHSYVLHLWSADLVVVILWLFHPSFFIINQNMQEAKMVNGFQTSESFGGDPWADLFVSSWTNGFQCVVAVIVINQSEVKGSLLTQPELSEAVAGLVRPGTGVPVLCSLEWDVGGHCLWTWPDYHLDITLSLFQKTE